MTDSTPTRRTRLRRWVTLETTSGVLLLAAAVVALVWANSPWRGAYVATKFAVLGLTLSMRADLAKKGVRATAICPGLIATNIIDQTHFSADRESMRARASKVFKSRGTPPSAVAEAIVDVIGTDTAVRPVTTEAWVAWGVTRFAPRVVADALGRMAAKAQERLVTSSSR